MWEEPGLDVAHEAGWGESSWGTPQGQGVREGVTKRSGKHLLPTPQNISGVSWQCQVATAHKHGNCTTRYLLPWPSFSFTWVLGLSLGSAERNRQCPAPVGAKLTSQRWSRCAAAPSSPVLRTVPCAATLRAPRRGHRGRGLA